MITLFHLRSFIAGTSRVTRRTTEVTSSSKRPFAREGLGDLLADAAAAARQQSPLPSTADPGRRPNS